MLCTFNLRLLLVFLQVVTLLHCLAAQKTKLAHTKDTLVFAALRKRNVFSLVVALPILNNNFQVYTNSFEYAFSAALIVEGEIVPVQYMVENLADAKKDSFPSKISNFHCSCSKTVMNYMPFASYTI